ncbi:Alpha/Beta hydrolase protein [Podospora didyma]|uniref:Carboxylic ester hydrolase n=1 Tax=Podospora didyma TaxID=330526 RepID=A0AAE0P0X2_9PEZI|nr:Alpha/Beta hydrolase protein [Podospora didyma]
MAYVQRLGALAAAAALLAPYGTQALFIGGGLTILSRNSLDADFKAALNASLSYQTYLGLAPEDQIYWIAKSSDDDDSCRGIDAAGREYDLDCLNEVPILCTQSAPVSTSKFADNARAWQVTQYVGNKRVTGYRDYHTWKFRGLRYADMPARFGYSAATAKFEDEGEVDATNAGADCSQPIGEVKNGSSEDCLFANVWTTHLPRMGDKDHPKKPELKPVMLYLYGGGLTSGSGKNPNTDGTNLASRGDVVVVSVNYRVGSIGFLNLNDGIHRGNYGISDMVSALEWVNKYIAYFGGDPDRVTLFGESAGALGTHVVLGVPKAKGLFHRAIMQSGPDGYPSNGKILQYPYYDSLKHNYATTTKTVLREAGCTNATDVVACLGKLSGFDLVNLTTNANGIVVDGIYLTYHELVVNSSSASVATNVSVMVGFNRDEAGVNIDNYPSNTTTLAEYFNTEVGNHFSMPSNASSILRLVNSTSFPGTAALSTPAGVFDLAVRIATDAVFTCFGLAKAYSGAKHSAFKSTYVYQFNRTYQTSGYTRPWCIPPKTAARPNGDPDGEYKKCHAGEQMVVFGTERRGGAPDRDGLDVPFMGLVVDYWAAFARTGEPDPDREALKIRGHWSTLKQLEKTGKWEKVDPRNPTLRLLQWNGGQVPFVDGDICKALGAGLDVLE